MNGGNNMSIEKETLAQIKRWAKVRKEKKITQIEMSKITGVSRPNIANFENGRVNNMYLYNMYRSMFD
jgi:DNA-binding XRE family transcriptional regulator